MAAYSFHANCPLSLRAFCVAACVALGCQANVAVPTHAAESEGAMLDLKTERVIVFKDGYALILKRGVAVTGESGEVYTDEVPDAAVLGSFWATPKEGRMTAMVAGWVEEKQSEERSR